VPNSSSASQPVELIPNKLRQERGSAFLSSRLGIIILFLGFNYTLMGTVIYPALPGLQLKYHLNAAQLSLMASLPALVSMSLQPVVGWISDHVDRKVIVACGLLAYALGGAIVGWVILATLAGYLLVLMGRAFSGLGELGAFPQYLAVIHEKLPPENQQQMVGIMEALTSSGSVLAPLIGGVLATLSVAFPFFATSAFGVIALGLAWWAIPSLKKPPSKERLAEPPGKFIFHFSYLGGSLIMGTLVSINTFLGSYLQTVFGFNTTQIGLMLAASPLAMAIGAMLAGRHGRSGYLTTHNLALGGLLGVAGLVLMGAAQSPWVVVIGLFASGGVLGYWLSAFDHDAMSSGDPGSRGLRLSFFQQAKAAGILVFPFLLGIVIDATGSIPLIYYLLAFSLLFIGTIILSLRYRYQNL